jgi:DMSO/TMAO reductase YedYZ molybdopterin-dependent catalytic subunit
LSCPEGSERLYGAVRFPRLRLPDQPPTWLRHGPLRPGAFRSALHDERTASLVGTALGVAFATAFVTGMISHELQHPASWWPLPTRPVWFYRFTQGLHVASGLASIPLLLAKLWTVYPRLFAWPPATSVLHGLERLSIFVLISGAIFELVTGLLNIVQWYPWQFYFTNAHYLVAWVTFGALLLHVAVKAPAIARGLGNSGAEAPADGAPGTEPGPPGPGRRRGAVSRRAMLTAIGVAVGAVTATTIGESVTSLRSVDVLAPRYPTFGPQGVPINRTAKQAQVETTALDSGWRLSVTGPRPYELSLAELSALPQHTAQLPIACVEGWSVNASWTGVRMVDLLNRVGAPAGAQVQVISLERSGSYRTMLMPHEYARDPLTLLALRLHGQPLSLDHGYPARIIAPARPGVLQTKWVSRIEVL